MKKENFFHYKLFPAAGEETFETLIQSRGFKVERIVSSGHADAEGEWYDQDHDEWVMLIGGEAVLMFQEGGTFRLSSGDYLFIPAHKKHKVLSTSKEPPCVWLAIHGKPAE
ncbi:MAG: cupin domain-containing protein [Bacteroidota bacterium]